MLNRSASILVLVGVTALTAGCGDGGAAGNAPPTCAQVMCASTATCSIVDGVARCTCPAGMDDPAGDGKVCKDRNECAATPGPCAASASCTDTPTSFTCACKPGFTGTGVVCSACTTCGAGQYQTAACGPTRDTACGTCDADCAACTGIGACTACTASHYLSGGTCVACSSCAPGQFQTAPCTATQDTACAACTTCGAGTYQAAACGGTSDTVCGACSPCSAGTYETGACGGMANRVCSTCAVCGAGQYETAACTTTSNRACATCSTCGTGQYQTAACGPTTNTACATCATCGAGQYQAVACGATTNTVCTTCSTCGAGQYLVAACGVASNTACGTCGNCGVGSYVSVACGGSSDTVCAACAANCDACTSAGACTACATGYALNAGACMRKGTSCRDIHLAHPSDPDGVYRLDPDGGSDANAFFAYCDMTADGGGWMKILQYTDAAYTPSAAAVGDIAVAGIPAMAKLADANINSLSALTAVREYRIQGATTPKKLFMKTGATWDDTARSHGLIVTGTGHACEALTNCTYVAVTTTPGRPTIDSTDWSPSSINGLNNEDRYFTDYGATPNCYTTGSTTQRCYSTGSTLGHALIPNLAIWTRELPITDDI